MHVTIDRALCISCGACWNTCPLVFWQNPCDAFAEIAEEFRYGNDRAEGFVPEGCDQYLQEAERLCPAGIIAIREV